MYYETSNFEELIQYMASMEKLGLYYVIQRDTHEVRKGVMGFIKKPKVEPLWKLQVIQYKEEEVNGETETEEIPLGRPSEGETELPNE